MLRVQCSSSISGLTSVRTRTHSGAVALSASVPVGYLLSPSVLSQALTGTSIRGSTSTSGSITGRFPTILMPSTKQNDVARRVALTHFLCIPFVGTTSRPQLEHALSTFKEDICTEQSQHRLPVRAIRPVGSIHLTLGVMSLDQGRLSEAVRLLEQMSSVAIANPVASASQSSSPPPTAAAATSAPTVAADDALPLGIPTSTRGLESLTRPISPPPSSNLSYAERTPITVDLTSLLAMRSPRKTSILYAFPNNASGRLYNLCEEIRKRFAEAGYLVPDDRPLKLHATVVNTIYVRGRDREKFLETQQLVGQHESTAKATDRTTAREPTTEAIVPDNAEGQASAAMAKDPKQDRQRKKASKAPLNFDATTLIEKYKDHVWARDVPVERIAICEMGAKDVKNESGEVIDQVYTEVASAPLF